MKQLESADHQAVHPGVLVRTTVVPPGTTVTQAAKLMGISRPALSNFLNGKASMTAEMATRLEAAFGRPRAELLEMQARYDAVQAGKASTPSDARAYVPPFLEIRANQLETWAENIQSRSRLAVLLRRLVHSTCNSLTQVDFPGNDDSERPGWDGWVEASNGTPWVPEGKSGWEFGTNQDVKTKADGDYAKSCKAIDKRERQQTTFVFVTPRRWPGKQAWVRQKKANGDWKDVRAYDSSDLEQWFEQSIAVQAWFANEIHHPHAGARSLDKSWDDWANVSIPPLPSSLYQSAIQANQRKLADYLSSDASAPFVVAADSVEEALAFLARAFLDANDGALAEHRDRVVVFDEPGVLSKLAGGATQFVPVVWRREIEHELGKLSNKLHAIVVYPRNWAEVRPDVLLEPVEYLAFHEALQAWGKSRDEVARLDRESGRSLTVLRRRLAHVPAIRAPQWASDQNTAAKLVPFLLVGAWNCQNSSDTAALSMLSPGHEYQQLERALQESLRLDDTPVWSIGSLRGVVSKLDLLYAIAGSVTKDAIERYFQLAEMVLGEDDPALDLEPQHQWAAAIFGKSREFSAVFRSGIAETLVQLSVHGRQLFQERLGVDTEELASQLVRKLLPRPLTTRKLEANDRDLPTYAEAAPEEFLGTLEEDLKAASPAVVGLLTPVASGVLAHPRRTGLLWALEGLAWNPKTLVRVVLILARLSEVEIKDNWVNKPLNSLEGVFCAWMPQTAANVEQRVQLMKTLASKFPHIAWGICVTQLSTSYGLGIQNHKPRWRSDAFGAGEPHKTWGPVLEFRRAMLTMAIDWPDHTVATLSELIERLNAFEESDQDRVWTLVEAWAKGHASDEEKAILKEKVRVSVVSRRAALRTKKAASAVQLRDRARKVMAALEPTDLLNRHAWLFRETRVEESADELEEEEMDFNKQQERLQDLRLEALRETWENLGDDGVIALARSGKTAWSVGYLAASRLLSHDNLVALLKQVSAALLREKGTVFPLREVLGGALGFLFHDRIDLFSATVREIGDGNCDDDKAVLLLEAPFGRETWKLVDELSDSGRSTYWNRRHPRECFAWGAEQSEGLERLIAAERPRAAFFYVQFQLKKLEVRALFQLLSEVAKGGKDQPGEYLLEGYHLREAFEALSPSDDLSVEEKAGLELAFLAALRMPGERAFIPSLTRYLKEHPEFFVQAVVWVYRREDGETDTNNGEEAPEQRQSMAKLGQSLLDAFADVPGTDEPDESAKTERLAQWVNAVRKGCDALSRRNSGDYRLGELLANAPVGSDGVWPDEPVRSVIEDIQSEHIMDGMRIGVRNSRGVVERRPGGDQERELAQKYHRWAEALRFSHPYVATQLLDQIANTYENEGTREDIATAARRRLP